MRSVQGEELLSTNYLLRNESFFPAPQARSLEDQRRLLPYDVEKYYLVIFEDETPVATASCTPYTQAVRGQVYPMGAIASVATHPGARRKGYSRRIMTAMFAHMQENGMVVSGLHPFRESFYERLGYVPFAYMRYIQVAATNLAPLMRLKLSGAVERLHIHEGYDVYRNFLLNIQPQIHGMALRPPQNASMLRDDAQYWVALARDGDQLLGLMTYRITDFIEDLIVHDFYYTSSQGKYLLLDYLARHIDQVKHIILRTRPEDRLETWWSDLEIALSSREMRPSGMGRVVMVEGLNGLQTGPGMFTARITDSACPWNEAIFRFETVDGQLQVSRAAKADCELSIQGLGALVYLGHEPSDFVYRGWGDPAPEVQSTLCSMFPPMLPFIHEDF